MKRMKEIGMLMLVTGVVIIVLYLTGFGCPIRRMTGISCPGCGMTRAVIAAFRLDFAEAFYYHPLFWILPFIAFGILLKDRIPEKIYKGFVLAFTVLFISAYIIRMANPDNYVVGIDIKSGLLVKMIRKGVEMIR